MISVNDAQKLIPLLREALVDTLGEVPAELSPIRWDKTVADATAKFLIRDSRDKPLAALLCGDDEAGELIRRNIVRAQEAQAALGPELGQHVLVPLCSGEDSGRMFAAYEYCKPIQTGRLRGVPHRLRFARPLLLWLRAATSATRTPVSPAEAEGAFHEPLQHFLAADDLPPELRAEANAALEWSASANGGACHVLTHYDFWAGNILRPARSGTQRPLQFVVIDWPGSTVRGYGIYDLVRLAGSMRLSPTTVRREAVRHCEILQCDLPDARSHLAVSIASLGMRLEHFPRPRYLQMSQRCFSVLDSAGVIR